MLELFQNCRQKYQREDSIIFLRFLGRCRVTSIMQSETFKAEQERAFRTKEMRSDVGRTLGKNRALQVA